MHGKKQNIIAVIIIKRIKPLYLFKYSVNSLTAPYNNSKNREGDWDPEWLLSLYIIIFIHSNIC